MKMLVLFVVGLGVLSMLTSLLAPDMARRIGIGGVQKPVTEPASVGEKQADIGAIEKRFEALVAAQKFGDALLEAQKLEVAIREQLGTNNRTYATILDMHAYVKQLQGNYAEAVDLYMKAFRLPGP